MSPIDPRAVVIRPLREGDAEAFVEFRREALLDAPLAFVSSPDDDFTRDPSALRQQLRNGPDTVIFGAFADGMVGSVGLYRDRHRKAAHATHLWGMYVAPPVRRLGLGARLLEAAVRHAGSLPGVSWVHLSVTSAAPEARRLYESAGFTPWGEQADALRHDGESVPELHMALRLDPAETR